MSDIVEKLRQRVLALRSASRQTETVKYDAELSGLAADKIEALTRELAESNRYALGAENRLSAARDEASRERWSDSNCDRIRDRMVQP